MRGCRAAIAVAFAFAFALSLIKKFRSLWQRRTAESTPHSNSYFDFPFFYIIKIRSRMHFQGVSLSSQFFS